jgi:cardiolipin synthase
MRGLNLLVLLVLVLPTAQPGLSSSFSFSEMASDRDCTGELLITEVCPGKPVEYVIMTNLGSDRSLENITVDDGEGSIVILANLTLRGGASLALAADGDVFSSLRPGVPFLEKGDPSIKWSSRFTLADGGDEVILSSPDHMVHDVVAYGTSSYNGEGWEGAAVGKVPKAHALLRCGGDTNSSADWTVEPPGRSDYLTQVFEAVVEPFSVPETAAGRIAREISMASRTVNCSVYEVYDPFIVDQLARCACRGVDVNLLIEGQPVGGLDERSLDALATLAAAGVEVRELRSVDSYKRYDYMHAKYMVVDGRRVTVMSENWGVGLYANRGWGVTLDGAKVGAYFDRVFSDDFNGLLDTGAPRKLGNIVSSTQEIDAPDEHLRYRCEVSPILSPDYSSSSLRELIASSMETVLVEQLSVEPEWLETSSLLTSLIEAAERGVKVRLLFDSSWDQDENQAVADELNDIAKAKGYDLEAKVISAYHGLSVMHNKGLVVDDTAVISSINWGDSALFENREVGVAVRSEQVAAYFSDLFWEDWSDDPIPPVVDLPWTSIQVPEGQPVLLDAANSSDNAPSLEFEWDVDGDGTVDSTAASWAIKLPRGNHTIMLTVRDRGNNTVTAYCWVEVLPAGGSALPMTTVALLAFPLTIVTVVMVWKRINLRKIN